MVSSIVSPTGTATSRERGSSVAPTDCKPVGPPVPRKSPKAPSRLATEPSPMLCMPPPAPPAAARLADRAGGDQARRNDHVQPAGRAVVNRQMDPLLTLAASDHVEIAGLAGLEQD